MAAIDVDRSVVMILDCQNEVLANHVPDVEGFLGRAASVLDAARKAGMPIIHVVVWFRPGHPEVHPRSQFRGARESGRQQEGTEAAAIHPMVAPKPGEIIVNKKRVGAFSGSDLDIVLRSLGRDNIIMLGILTGGAVLTTVRQASDLDYTQVILSDCCADFADDGDVVQKVLMERVFPRQATVMTSEEFKAALA